MIEAYNQYVFLACLLAIPVLIYVIQWINLHCTVYSKKDMELLSRYACQLKFMKLKYEQLTNDINNMALASEEQVDRMAKALRNQTNGSIRLNLFNNSNL